MTSESDIHINRDEVHLPPTGMVFTPVPQARAARQSRNWRGSRRTKADATCSSTRAFTVIEQTPAKSFRLHRPVFLTLGLFDKLVYLSFLVSCFLFFRALGGFGVEMERPGTIAGGTNARVLANRTTPSKGNITDIAPITDLGAGIHGDKPGEAFAVGRVSTTPKNRKALPTPLAMLPIQTQQQLLRPSPTVQASPMNLPWPLATAPSADYIFDYGLPGDVYAFRIHSPQDLIAQAEHLEYGNRRRETEGDLGEELL